MPRNHKDRCTCGLRTTLHYTIDNRKVSCDEARRLHPRATVRLRPLEQMLWQVVADEHRRQR